MNCTPRLTGGQPSAGVPPLAEGLLFSGVRGADGGVLGWFQANLIWLVTAWGLCAALLALRTALGLLWIRRAEQGRTTDEHWQARLTQLATEFGVTREVRLRVVDNLTGPLTAGWWRPVVLVPASLISGMPPHLLEALLAHEIGARQAARLSGQPRPERGRDPAVLPSCRVVDFGADPR